MEKFTQLKVWQKAHKLVIFVYQLTKKYPDEEKYNLVSQMRRAAISVAANIVEGTKRKTIKDRKNFHVIADTSLEELKYYFILSKDLKIINQELKEKGIKSCQEVGRMLFSLTKKL